MCGVVCELRAADAAKAEEAKTKSEEKPEAAPKKRPLIEELN